MMFRNLFRILLTTLALTGLQATAAQLEMNTDRAGGDYNSFDLPAANPQMCAARCEQDGRCRAFTYVGPGIQGPNARCWLKHQAPNPVGGRAGIVSGVVRQGGSSLGPNFQADMDRPGGDYSNFDLADANPELCAARCAQDGRCLAFTYVTPGIQGPSARCWLKDQAANPVPARGGVITGITRGSGPAVPPVTGTTGAAGGKLPPDFHTGAWTYAISGFTEQQSFGADGTARGSNTGRWSVEGNDLVVRWSSGWTTRYALPAVNGKMTGAAIRPDGSRIASTLSRQ
jgi:hypothetical protein